MSGFTQVPLDRLPAPQIVQTPDFDALLSEMKTAVIAAMPESAPLLELDSEPVTQVLRVGAYYRMLDRIEFNDRAQGNLLATASGADLEHLAAFWGVQRLVIQPENTDVSPPVPAVLESDSALRQRAQLAKEGFRTAGPVGAYLFHALSADGQVKDAAITSPQPGQVVVTVLAHGGSGAPSDDLLGRVLEVLSSDDVRPLTDQVQVARPVLQLYEVEASLTLFHGPDGDLVLQAAREALAGYITQQHRLGRDVTVSGLHAALHQPGVQNVQLVKPAADLVVGANGVAHCTAATVTVGGRNV
jgi:phage-related baseplate assembly protein